MVLVNSGNIEVGISDCLVQYHVNSNNYHFHAKLLNIC